LKSTHLLYSCRRKQNGLSRTWCRY